MHKFHRFNESSGYFLPKTLIESFRYGAVNIHPSLLPKYRGASPIQHAILNGDDETGVSIIEVHPEKFDFGNILKQERFKLSSNHTYSVISSKLVDLAMDMIDEVLKDLPGHRSRSIKQGSVDSAQIRAPKLSSKEKFITNDDWLDSTKIWNKYRTFEVLNCTFNPIPSKVSLFNLSPPQKLQYPMLAQTGDAFLSQDRKSLFIKSGTEFEWFSCKNLQLSGKKIVGANEFYNGYLLRINKKEDRLLSKIFG